MGAIALEDIIENAARARADLTRLMKGILAGL
jgi:hypothetical protein